ncbi:anion exchange protein 3 isoform X1 [Denticeps clupeoides]|uniref:Anion exchange protein n=2 Tax=Denticeps clupeoides TaxID=299321 RepID=A0AAY4DW19_9TELE|nr:anion exchange protein 3-like isoform X1 [Denticeps clupeoides]XP_028846948.1 anion exchange protein 3-like isoform X1 [Denticeps clupeoides]XP_028846949.1 anion exchange protein 3-like isoform X1 [Denticeps clupeoides]XP_028846950.1 anion exchange protein 3-like isoform X1 [Denticeps clupeoides]
MATGGYAPETDVLINLHQVLAEEEKSPTEGEVQEDEAWEKALCVERFGDIITDCAPNGAEKMGRSYNEKDFEYHRHTFHHTHHPLSTHLPPPQRFRKRVLSMDRRRKKKRKKKKTSVPPSEVTPTIHEVDEEEAESEGEGQGTAATPPELPDDQPQFSLGSEEDLVPPLPLCSFHMETECPPDSEAPTATTQVQEGQEEHQERQGHMEEKEEEAPNRFSPSPEPISMTTRGWFRRKPLHRLPGAQRTSYDLRERICIGSMTAMETAVYQKVPTDEAEAQMLASADLDDMKSHRFEDNPGVRRHLVKKSSRCQIPRTSNCSSPLSSLKKRKRAEKKTHEVFVELNELITDKNHEMRWKERARWIKFEEDVEEETDRWGKPHVASLSFRSLLELRRTITHGAILLDLEQTTLPGIAHLLVETMIISDQIRAEDRANVLRALLLKHSHPNDEKEGLFHRNHSLSSLGSFHRNHNHVLDTALPLVSEDHAEIHETKAADHDKEKSHHPLAPEGHAAARSMKLMAKIPKDAEATVVLVGCMEFLEQPAMAFVRLSDSVLLESVLEVPVPVRFMFVLLGPTQSNMDYHEIGRSFSTLMSDKNFHEVAYFADDRQDLLNGINEFLDCSIVIPPSDVEGKDLLKTVALFQKQILRKRKERENKKCLSATIGTEPETKDVSTDEQEEEELDVDPLKRSGIPFGGLIHDIRRRYPLYMSDIKDAIDSQCIAAVIFIYFAALSPTITFGGLLGEKTNGMMGVSELIISTATVGVLFSLLAGQPLLIIGFSGPLLVFEEAFFKFCQAQGFEYLTGRVWIGFWLIFIVLVIVAAEGSFLVRYISPFTQEIFAFLISLIFIYETFSKLIKVFQEHPLMQSYPLTPTGPSTEFPHLTSSDAMTEAPVHNQPNTALLSLVLMLGTFFVAFFLRKFRNSRFLGGKARRIIGDFGIPISILFSVIVDYSIPDTYTQKLNVPSGFSVTSPDKRGWFISPFGDKQPFPVWMMGASVVPALLVFILIFMETQITSLIVSKKERRLVKGSGFHLDLLLIVTLGAICPLFGLPWLTAATVRSVTHVNALTVMSKATAPGEKPMIQEVKEQRLTGMCVAVLVGMSIVMTDLLRIIPLAVLFGIFLYMGITSLTGIQLYERITLMVTPAKHHPDHIYVTKVKTWRMNMFTIIQLVCIVLLWVVKSTIASLAFPFILIMTVPLRRLILTRIFEDRELQALDADEDSPNFDEDGRDEYNEIHMLV